jgi:hypothetical protein
VYITKAVCNSFKKLKKFKRGIWNEISLFSKEKGHGCPIKDLEYPKGFILELKYKDNLVNRIYNTPLLTDYGFKNSFEDRNKATIL